MWMNCRDERLYNTILHHECIFLGSPLFVIISIWKLDICITRSCRSNRCMNPCRLVINTSCHFMENRHPKSLQYGMYIIEQLFSPQNVIWPWCDAHWEQYHRCSINMCICSSISMHWMFHLRDWRRSVWCMQAQVSTYFGLATLIASLCAYFWRVLCSGSWLMISWSG